MIKKDVFAVFFLGLILSSMSCAGIREKRLQADGDRVVLQIEAFEKQTGRLPNSLHELGIEEKEDRPIYYKKIDDSHFQVWFGTQLGESLAYDSLTKTWK